MMNAKEESALYEIEKCIDSDCLLDCPSDETLKIARQAIIDNEILRTKLKILTDRFGTEFVEI